MTDIDYDALDDGIREVVRWLNTCGYHTMDSGDGQKQGWKAEAEDILSCPHVMICSSPDYLVSNADSLKNLLEMIGLPVEELGPDLDEPTLSIQASYDPTNRSAILMLTGLTDQMLLEALGRKPT